MIIFKYDILDKEKLDVNDEENKTNGNGQVVINVGSSSNSSSNSTSVKSGGEKTETKTTEYEQQESGKTTSSPTYTPEEVEQIVNNRPDKNRFTNMFNRDVQKPDPKQYEDDVKKNNRAKKVALIGQMAQLMIDMGGAIAGGNVWKRDDDNTIATLNGKNDKLLQYYREALKDYNNKKYEAAKADAEADDKYRNELLREKKSETTHYAYKPTTVTTETKTTPTITKKSTTSSTDKASDKIGGSGKGYGHLSMNENGNYVLPILQSDNTYKEIEIKKDDYNALVNELKTLLQNDETIKKGYLRWMYDKGVWSITGKPQDKFKGKETQLKDAEERATLEFIMQNGNMDLWNMIKTHSADPDAVVEGIEWTDNSKPDIGFWDSLYEVKENEYDKILKNPTHDFKVVRQDGSTIDMTGAELKKEAEAVGGYKNLLNKYGLRVIK